MPFNANTVITEEDKILRKENKLAAQEERNRKIQEAIKNGAVVNYMTSKITQEEWETHISMINDGVCIIDTTIPKDMTTCLKCGWKIKAVTYSKETNNVVGMVFEGTSRNISIRTVK